MNCTKCNTELPPNAKFCSTCGTAVPSGTTVQVQQDISTVKGKVVGAVLGDGAPTTGLNTATTQNVNIVESDGTVVGTIVGGEKGYIHVGGEQHYGDQFQGNKQAINTDGGDYIEGGVNTGGDFVGRDKVDHSSKVGNINGNTGIAIDHGAQANVTLSSGVSADEIVKLFAVIYKRIDDRPVDPNVDKDELTQTVRYIEQETIKGEQANPSKIEHWLKTLASMAPDIGDVIVVTLTSPVGGIATVVHKVAEKAKTEIGQSRW